MVQDWLVKQLSDIACVGGASMHAFNTPGDADVCKLLAAVPLVWRHTLYPDPDNS